MKNGARARLDEAVQAMRNINNMKAGEWEKEYPTFNRAVESSAFRPSGNIWDGKIAAMNTELQLRMAEAMLSVSEGDRR